MKKRERKRERKSHPSSLDDPRILDLATIGSVDSLVREVTVQPGTRAGEVIRKPGTVLKNKSSMYVYARKDAGGVGVFLT